jgi:hypothetical protein
MTSKICAYGGDSCGPQTNLFGGFCRNHYRLLKWHGSFERPALPCTHCETGCHLSRAKDPSGGSMSGRNNRHYLRHTREAKQAALAKRAKSKPAARNAPADSPKRRPIGRMECGQQARLHGGVCSKHYYCKSKWGSYQLEGAGCEGRGGSVARSTDASGANRALRFNIHNLRRRRAGERSAPPEAHTCPIYGADTSAGRNSKNYCSSCAQARRRRLGRP